MNLHFFKFMNFFAQMEGGKNVLINGKEMDFENISVHEMLQKLGLSEDQVVVEVNFEIISREKYKEHILNKADRVEIVSFVGGG